MRIGGIVKYSSPILIMFLLISFICLADVPVEQVDRDKVLSAGPEWKGNYDSCKPDPARIEALKSRLGNVRIDIYLGLWCPDSRNNVPPFIKIIDATDLSVPIRFFTCSESPGREFDITRIDSRWKKCRPLSSIVMTGR